MSRNQLLVALAALALGGSAATLAYFKFSGKPTVAVVQAPAAATTNGQTLHYAPGAPQLDYIKTLPVTLVPAPLVEPMTARVAMDEDHTARVFSPVAGRVLRIFVEPGATVKKGDPLVEIDSPDYGAALSDLRKAKADFERKQHDWQRQKDLFQAGVVARKDLEGAEADYNAAKAEQDRANERFRNLSTSGNESGTFTLRAPLDGTVADRQVNPGTEVRPDAANPLFVITNMSHLWLLLDAPESALGRLEVGQHVTVLSDTDPALSKVATIANLPANVDPSTRRLLVRCVLDNTDNRLRPEMFVRAIPYADDADEVIRVPDTALVTRGLYSFVFVETAPGTLERRRVHVLLQGHGESFIDTGLKVGETVVVTGALLLDSELNNEG